MAALAWLLIPLFAVVGAAIWGSWASRNKTIGDVAELAGYARFRDAMERSPVTTPDSALPGREPATAAGGVTTSPSS
ncbi:hypothetical protein OG462_28720 [Streptomyces sp. NBC_01077]|uniref:hypothetical protein n=1 Tax=Streptomyces sp. NBC_01077 TaxID=2903746 RepID=UPI00386CA9AD|nr:hypothetical protein OG462_28720 [Streptomyces sp. NBC_01077]